MAPEQVYVFKYSRGYLSNKIKHLKSFGDKRTDVWALGYVHFTLHTRYRYIFFLLFYFRYYLLRVTALELITGRPVYNDYGEDDFNNPEFWKDVLGRKFETKIEELNISDAGKSSTEY